MDGVQLQETKLDGMEGFSVAESSDTPSLVYLEVLDGHPKTPRRMRGFGGDSKREEVTGLALSGDGRKIYWSGPELLARFK